MGIFLSSAHFSPSVMSNSLRLHELQHTRPPCPSPTLELVSIESMMPFSHLILFYRLLLLPSIFPRIRVFSNELALRIRQPKCWNFTFSLSASKEHQGRSPSEWTGCISLQSKGLSRVFSNTRIRKHQFINAQASPVVQTVKNLCAMQETQM